MIKVFLKCRSKVMVKVTSSLTLVPYESVLLVEYACQV